MKKLYTGKTKDVYEVDENSNLLIFKDDMTGKDGVFDPGANEVGLKVSGAGHMGLLMSSYFFEKAEKTGIPTHYISSDLEKQSMLVKPVTFFGKGIEVICRYTATGSFIRRYGMYMEDGAKLEGFIEVSLKDDERGDPFISKELLSLFEILTDKEYDIIKTLTKATSSMIKSVLEEKNLELLDLKLEFGKDKAGNIILIDELSGGNMRVMQGENKIDPIQLAGIITN